MEDKNTNKLSVLERYKKNPFLEGINLEHYTKTEYLKGDVTIIGRGGNENVTGIHSFARSKKVDSEKFCKIYMDTLSIWFELRKPAQKTLLYILAKLTKNADFVVISKHDYPEITGTKSRASMYDGLCELCNKGIIAKSYDPNVYFINPSFIFNGNRMAIMEVFEIKGSEPQNEIDKISQALKQIPDGNNNQDQGPISFD